MIPTFIGVAIAAIGMLLLFRGSLLAMFTLLVACTPLNGSAALLLPALGGSSVPPVQFAMLFMVMRLFVGEVRFDIVWDALARNAALLVYVPYAVAIAMIGPRMFDGDMYVFPMRMLRSGPGSRMDPLAFSPQNITAATYLVGLLLMSVSASVAMMYPGGARRLVKVVSIVAIVQAFLGVSGALLVNTPWNDVLELFRNGSYANLDQNMGSFARIHGLSPEPSSFAMCNFILFVFLFECWLRDVMPRLTGIASALIGVVLLISTSSTAYLGFGGYGAILALRLLLVRGAVPVSKILILAAIGLVGLTACMAAYVLVPAVAAMVGDMVHTMTVGKTTSGSAMERAVWAKQGIDAFVMSSGIGIGPGSFRSSSLITAIIGSTGVIGSSAFLIHVLRVLKPLRPSTYVGVEDGATAVGVAASWATFVILIPAAMVVPGVDPGPEFALLGGAALALRWRSYLAFGSARKRQSPHGQEDRSLVAA